MKFEKTFYYFIKLHKFTTKLNMQKQNKLQIGNRLQRSNAKKMLVQCIKMNTDFIVDQSDRSFSPDFFIEYLTQNVIFHVKSHVT